jgi:hypothetical protein
LAPDDDPAAAAPLLEDMIPTLKAKDATALAPEPAGKEWNHKGEREVVFVPLTAQFSLRKGSDFMSAQQLSEHLYSMLVWDSWNSFFFLLHSPLAARTCKHPSTNPARNLI